MINAKVFVDGDRVILSFEGMEDATAFLEDVLKLASGTLGENVTCEEVPNLDNPPETPPEVLEPEVEDFEEPYTGKTPEEIFKTPKFEGFYFLCDAIVRHKVPEQFKDECKKLVVEQLEKITAKTPYEDPNRMVGYLTMAQRIFGNAIVPDEHLAREGEALKECCAVAEGLLTSFADNVSKS